MEWFDRNLKGQGRFIPFCDNAAFLLKEDEIHYVHWANNGLGEQIGLHV